ncbi:MAG: 50S ribosomal protein L29 [Patescibacteria group bacterium]|nr:50S ribosomal protein L29 [Patescibacteria group bacterium]
MTKKETMASKTDTELVKILADTRAALRTERFSAAGARAKDSNSPCKLRKVIARVLTEQHARTLKTGSINSLQAA